jgi:5-methylcytosine-specific restriction endonuclease McrA
MDKKTCSVCKKELFINAFPKSSTGKYRVHSWCKNCHREYGIINKEKRHENTKRYRENNVDKIKELRKIEYINQRDKNLKYAKEYRNKNKGKVLSRTKKWISNNMDRYKELCTKWRKENKERVIELSQRRRARLKGGGGSYTAKEWIDLCNKFQNRCLCCGNSDLKLTVDHIVPISKGGANYIENIQPLCKSCNSKKHTNIIDYRIIYA